MICKHFHNIMIVGVMAALLALTACSGDEFDSTKKADGTQFGLTVVTNDQVTTRTPGDDNLNENRFVSIDYFFFAQNQDEDKLLLHKTEGQRLDANNSTLDISSHTYNGPLSESEIITLFGDDYAAGDKCYVYVLTNLLSTTRAAIEEEKATWGEDFDLGKLKHISFQDIHISDNTTQECFVMFGGGEVSLSIDGTTNVKTIAGNPIRVTRDAAKVVLTITNVQEELEVMADDGVTVVSKWKSVPEQSHVMFYRGKNKSNVHSQINAGMHYVPEANDDCYFDLTAKNDKWRTLVASSTSEPYKNLTHTYPFYTYLSDWTEASGADPKSYMILMVPWQQVDVETGANIGAPRATYYQVETTTTDTYYENYYYHIFINVGILGSFEIPEPVKVDGTYMIVPWGEKDIDATMREPIYLIVEKDTVVMSNAEEGRDNYITSHPIENPKVTKIEYMDYSGVTIYRWTIEKGSFTNNGTTYTYRIRLYNTTSNNPLGTWYCNSNPTGSFRYPNYNGTTYYYANFVNDFESFVASKTDSEVILTHEIDEEMYVPYNVTVEVKNPKISDPETIVFTQYPPIYISAERSNGYAWVNSYSNNRSGNRACYDDIYGNLGNFAYRSNAEMGTGENTNPNNYIISISSFSPDDPYVIGDPRTDNVNNLTNLGGLENYRPTRRTGTEDMIAPKILVASSYGVVSSNYYFNRDAAEKRCASYQENGYPAGRWRVPTAAEIKYIMSLNAKGVIPSLFNLGRNDAQGYWCANGKISGDANAMPYLSNDTQNTAVRCVYDIWYWGEEHNATTFTWGD